MGRIRPPAAARGGRGRGEVVIRVVASPAATGEGREGTGERTAATVVGNRDGWRSLYFLRPLTSLGEPHDQDHSSQTNVHLTSHQCCRSSACYVWELPHGNKVSWMIYNNVIRFCTFGKKERCVCMQHATFFHTHMKVEKHTTCFPERKETISKPNRIRSKERPPYPSRPPRFGLSLSLFLCELRNLGESQGVGVTGSAFPAWWRAPYARIEAHSPRFPELGRGGRRLQS